MTWARDLARVIRSTERDARLRSAEVLRDGGWGCHGQVDLSGNFLLHPLRGAPLLDHQCSFRLGIPVPSVILCWCDWLVWASYRWRWRSSMCYFTWRGCVSERRDWGLLPHLCHAFAEFLELAAVLEHVARLLFSIPLVDVEADGAWTRKLFVCGGSVIAVAALPRLRWASPVAEVSS